MKKIIQLLPTLNDGGAETLVKDYALLMNKEKFETVIVVTKNITTTANFKHLSSANIRIIPLYNEDIYSSILRRFTFISRLKKIIKDENPNVIHAHLGFLPQLASLSEYLNKKNIKIFYTCHSLPKCFFKKTMLPKFIILDKRKRAYLAAKKLLKNMNFQIIALHTEMKKELEEMFNTKQIVENHNGINFKRFYIDKTQKVKKRTELGIPLDSYVIGNIGRFADAKNHDFLIQIFNEIKKQRNNAYLLMVGDGELKNRIEHKIMELGLADDCLILSNRTDIPALLNCMDVFVFPSKYEGLGIVVVEALACGLRCVVSKNVPTAAYLCDRLIPVGLEETASHWGEVVMNETLRSDYEDRLYTYDMNQEVIKLESLYY